MNQVRTGRMSVYLKKDKAGKFAETQAGCDVAWDVFCLAGFGAAVTESSLPVRCQMLGQEINNGDKTNTITTPVKNVNNISA